MSDSSKVHLEQSQWERLIAAERTLRLKGVREGVYDLFEKFIVEVEREGEPKPVMRTLAQMIEAGRYDWTNDDITEKKFTVNPERFTTANTKVYHFNKVMSTEAVATEMAKDGYEPAFIENLLAHGAENPEDQRKYPIVALGSSCVSRFGSVCSPCLFRDDDGRGLGLSRRDGGWSVDYRFLAVRKSAL